MFYHETQTVKKTVSNNEIIQIPIIFAGTTDTIYHSTTTIDQ